MTNAKEYARQNSPRFFEELLTLMRIPSISTQPEHAADVQAAAEWIARNMRTIGLEAEIISMPAGRHPLVFGSWNQAGNDAPTVLIYCHYDVQPAEMEDGWTSNPFEPIIRDGKLFGRGAGDSKINVITQLKAVESLIAANAMPVNIKLLFEGEEESGGETITQFVQQHADRLSADVCVISDGGIIDPDQPSLVLGLRGITAMELHVHGPVRDLHSGHYGGNVHNPAQALCEIIAQLHDANGTVTVPGFYDNVVPLDPQERQRLAGIDPWYQADWQRGADAPQEWGEAGYSLQERAGIRPTLEINGIRGGYSGDGVKTVLPASAMAKISCRLVSNQDPERIVELVQSYVAQITPPTVRSEIVTMEMGAPAVYIPSSSKAMQAASTAYENQWDKPTLFEVAGGSVPITTAFQQIIDQTIMMGYSHKGSQAHGPNEHIYVRNFDLGIATAIEFLQLVGEKE